MSLPATPTHTRTAPAKPKGAPLRWLLFFYLPVLLSALGLSYALMENGRALDDALLGNQRVAGTATRMGTLAEQIEKSLLLIERSVREEQPVASAIYELQRSADRLDQIIGCFNDGGETVAPDNSRIMITPITDERAAASLQELNTIWFGIKNQSDKVIRLVSQNKPLTVPLMREASEFVHGQAGRFSEQSLAYSKRLEQVLKDASADRQSLQGIGSALAMLAWGSLPVVFLLNRSRRARNLATATARELGAKQSQLEQKTNELSTSKSETDRIMETVQEGLLLMDRESVIGTQYSAELRGILRIDSPAGLSLLNQLQRLLTEKMYNTTKDYFALLFDARRKEKTVLKVNPLDQVEVHFSNPAGGFLTRHLGFSFRRIMDGDQVSRVFVAIKDITAQVELERSLREAEKKKDHQLEILLNIIHVEEQAVVEFSQMAIGELQQINDALKAEDFAASLSNQAEALRPRLQRVFSSVHNIKGNAAVLGLEYFSKACGDFESRISELLSRATLGGDDFISIVILQSNLKSDLTELQELQEKMGKLRPPARAAALPVAAAAPEQAEDKLAATLEAFAIKTAQELGKQVTVDIDSVALRSFGPQRRALLRDVLIQLTRNALAHSLETPEQRTQLGKAAAGKIRVSALPRGENGLVGLLFRDDGQGLNLERIRARAVESKLLAQEEAAALDENQVAALIFEPGLSTASEAGDHAGRGMGMDIIRTKIIDEAGGDLHLQSEPGVYCEFGIYLPEAA